MENENPICTFGDYSRPSNEGYRNTIELPDGNNVVPLRSDTIWLVQNGCSFHGLRSEDPNQHLKDFLKLVDSLDLDVANRERTRLMDSLQGLTPKSSSSWNRYLAPNVNFYGHVSFHLKREIDRVVDGKLRDKNAEESWEIIKNLALYDHEGWNDSRDFAKPVKAISLPQDVPSASDRRLVELENQVQRLMEAHLAPNPPDQVNKIASSCEICSGPHDTQYCMENSEQAFVKYASSRSNEVGGNLFSSSPKRVYFVNTITVLRKEEESREAGTKESDTAEDESRDIKRNDPDDRMCREMKEVEEVEKESEESEEEIEEETE
ncbi:hypothetical protein Tco_0629309 [Tanacetum coccineum]|uniref:MAK10-like protein n=1 Tax=Tanacetum coccineum TaxID=301880 RepID=A0ABQ4WSV0_9ASTR